MKKIKDNSILVRLKKAVRNVTENPEKGKFLKRELKGKKSIRIKPFRIIFEAKESSITFHTFEHRSKAYKRTI